MSQWAHVVYKIDNTKANVPISFVENYEETEIEIDQDYYVFWSLDPNETPDIVLKKRGKVPRIEKIKRIPTAGWYLATILFIADSEQELNTTLVKRKNKVPAVQHKESGSNDMVEKLQLIDSVADLPFGKEINTDDNSQTPAKCIEKNTDENDEYMSRAVFEIQSLKFKTTKLERRNENLLQIIIESNNKILELEEMYEKTKEKLESTLTENEKMNDLERWNENLMQTLNEKNNKILELENLCKSGSDKLEDSIFKNRKLEEVKKSNETLIQNLAEKNAKISELEDRIKLSNDKSISSLSEQENANEPERQIIETLVQTLSENNNKILELEKSYKLTIDKLEADNDKLSNLNFKLQEQLCSLISQFSASLINNNKADEKQKQSLPQLPGRNAIEYVREKESICVPKENLPPSKRAHSEIYDMNNSDDLLNSNSEIECISPSESSTLLTSSDKNPQSRSLSSPYTLKTYSSSDKNRQSHGLSSPCTLKTYSSSDKNLQSLSQSSPYTLKPYSSPEVIDVKRMLSSSPKGQKILSIVQDPQEVISRIDVCQLVRICVGCMVADLKSLYPTCQQKINLAKAIVQAVPALKSERENVEGYETFFDPNTHDGSIEFRLKNMRRLVSPLRKKNKRRLGKLDDGIEVLDEADEEDMSRLLASNCEIVCISPSESCSALLTNSDGSIQPVSLSSVYTLKPYSSPEVIDIKQMLESRPKGIKLLSIFEDPQQVISRRDLCELVRICVGCMVTDLESLYPTTEQKINLAKAIVQAIPALKSERENVEGYETFFDPINRDGSIEFRLKTMRRHLSPSSRKHKRKLGKVDDVVAIFEDADEEEDVTNKILWLQYQVPSEIHKEEIFKTMEETFNVRRNFISKEIPSICEILNKYPKLLDFEGALIDAEFKNLLPGAGSFMDNFLSFYTPRILRYVEKSRLDLFDKHAIVPNEDFRALLMIADLLTLSCWRRKNRTKDSELRSPSDALVRYIGENMSFKEEVEKSTESRPQLFSIGSKSSSENNFFLVLDNKTIHCGTCPLKAFDFLYKSHYVFNVEYCSQLILFYNFMDHMVYKVKNGPARSLVEGMNTLISAINP